MTTNPTTRKVNTQANLMAHAVLGAVVAQVQGNSALAGAAGATTCVFIAQQLYPDILCERLSEEQKQTISMLVGSVGNITVDRPAGIPRCELFGELGDY